ncbi:YopX family protein [Listeria cossartiae]|uniref:YopX family protein n=1 Tax=Listeria cossartiae TaxID=2838249 RepID=UPI001E5AA84F|nr:YopX family protein [Listeria cossartiae]MCD2223218.1 YopX family protein [Listeria cossartiae]MCD2237897.1 YopX family protein [Listeria cossartiae]
MREIEFRAWDKEVKEMDYNPSVIEIWQNKPINEQFRLESEEKLIWMQYTGLKDKSGKKIFEGDIVAFSEDDFHVFNSQVEYFSEDGYPAFDIKVPSTYYFDSNVFSEVSMTGLYEIEVIGNIHENPELLEETE